MNSHIALQAHSYLKLSLPLLGEDWRLLQPSILCSVASNTPASLPVDKFLLCSLTDPLVWDHETIFMNVSVRGTYPGNIFDTTPYVQLSDISDNFTSADLYQYRRSINVSTTGWASACFRAQAICKAA